MERKPKKMDEKQTDKPKDRGDKKNLLHRLLQDLDIDFVNNRDRGDSKPYLGDRSSRNLSEKPTNKSSFGGAKKKLLDSTSEAKSKKPTFILDSDDSSKKGHRIKLHKARKNLEETQDKTVPIVRNTKIKTESKARTYSEQVLKSKPDFERIRDTKGIDENVRSMDDNAKIDEKTRRISEEAKVGEEVKRNDIIKNLRLPPGKDLKYIGKDALERRAFLRRKYTVKLKNSCKIEEDMDTYKNEDHEINDELSEIIDRRILNDPPKEILQRLETKQTRKSKEDDVPRKLIIKTIRNNDHRVYKAVTFIDQKETTPLQIKMPNSKKTVETNTAKNKSKEISRKVSVENVVKKKPNEKKNRKEKMAKRVRKRPSSPALTVLQGCPPTEVAKWAPSSITQHTKPYYEAWVDTTLAAITKCSEKDKQKFNNQHVIRTFKRALELESRPNSPVYENVNDEKYMGKIRVKKSK